MPEVDGAEKLEIFPLDLNEVAGSLKMTTCHTSRPHSQNGYHSTRAQYIHTSRTRSFSMGSPDRHSISSSVTAAILYRDSSGGPVLQPLSSFGSQLGLEDDIINFFKCYKCYDLIPTSAKIVVLDTQLVVKKAFLAMVETGVRACPLWDSRRQQFVGMLTITDFIRILQKNYRGPNVEMEAFEEQRLCEWKGITEQYELYHMYPDSSLYDAAAILIKHKIHRLPIIDPSNGNVLYVMTQKPLLKFLSRWFPKEQTKPAMMSLLNKTIGEMGVGTYNNIQVATKETLIIEALNKFVEERISALPIVNENGALIDIYSKFDVINLAAEKTYSNLDVPLGEATKFKSPWFSGVLKCRADDSVLTVIEKLVEADVYRLVIVDSEDKVIGIVTVSDILRYLVLRQRNNNRMPRNMEIRREDSIGEEIVGSNEDNEERSDMAESLGSSASPPRWFHV